MIRTEVAARVEAGGERLLERAAELSALGEALAAVRGSGQGRLVLLAGEPGIGKTSLLRAFCAAQDGVAAFQGGCDPLFTPRPLAPFLELAEAAGGRLAARLARGRTPADVVAALVEELPRRGPALLVVEDLHWADEATLDVVRLLGRRIESMPLLVVLSYRDEHVDRGHPLRIVLGDLPPAGTVRLALAPLSAGAIETLAGDESVDADALARRTGGNPFFVTEVLAARGAELPATVRDAVLGRAARLSAPARRILDAVSIFPPRAELALLEECVPGYPDGLGECMAAGMLHPEGTAVAFRHEIARFVLDAELPPHERMALHRAALHALARTLPPDPARLAYHAEGAGDREAVLRWAPVAAERAAALGSHREAAKHYARALREADGLTPERRAELHERRSYECYLTDQMPEALDARLEALAEHRRRGDRLREGDAHRWVSRLRWFLGENVAAERAARDALDLLEELPPGPELAMAYSNISQLRMLARDCDGGIVWGERAIALADQLGEVEILVHALNNVGTSQLQRGDPAGRATLERSLDLALEAGLEEHAARAFTNLASQLVETREYAPADDYLARGIAYCRNHDVDSWLLYMTGWLARSHLDQGRWDEAAEAATTVLRYPNPAAPSRIKPLTVVGRLRSRRGDPGAWEPLDEALQLAEGMAELQRLAPVAAARAEARWLAGEHDLVAGETGETLAVAIETEDPWAAGELAVWRRRAGVHEDPPEIEIAVPWALELAGDGAAAARAWSELGCPYEAALALTGADGEEPLRRSLAELERLGATRAAACVARMLRSRHGVRGVVVGPRAATRANPGGLTVRELDVLELLTVGLRNREIAARLYLSEKTVHHHVSAILRKLAVPTRGQAAAEAARLGIAKR
jgi:DNA-binding CsgD family transcriptional regulator/tetratricopeptide (TPR) repeat protein